MNSRPLSPFLISFALVAFSAASPRATAVQSSALDSFTSPLSSYRYASADAAGFAAQESQTALARPAPVAVPELAADKGAPVVPHTLNREAALASLQKLIAEHFNLEGDLQLELLRPWTDPAPSAKPLSLCIAEFPSQASSSMPLRLRIEAEGKLVTEFSLLVRAQLWRDAWVSRLPIAREDVFDPALLELRRVDVLREREALLSTTGDRTQAFTRSIPAGRLLSWRDIAPRSLVRKGEMVEVAAIDGAISVSMKAIALQNGAAGDTISVRNPDSKRDISAKVVGEKRVVVRF